MTDTSSAAFPPPVGGWDTRNALADMPAENAIILDNWFPGTDRVTLRPGYAEHVTGLGSAVETLMDYTPLDGDTELFGAAGGSIFDVSAAGAVGSAEVTGLTNNRFQHVNMGTTGGQFLIAVNGQDTPRLYDGSTWGTTSITGSGLTAASVEWVNIHQRRLWLGERDSLTAWYLGTNAIAGTATAFFLGGVAKLGGFIMAMGTWTRDAGDGQDDVAVFLTSEGEAIVYAGTDPANAATWALIGVFRVGRPIGRRCMIKAGADLIMVTEDGFVAASQILALDRSRSEIGAISSQINQAVNDAVRVYGNAFGWQPIIYPRATMLIFNIPQAGNTSHQYVFNTLTEAPCRFTGINARCWGIANNRAYFGGADGTVYLFDQGDSDDGADIQADALQAFNYFRTPARTKAFKRVELVMQSSQDPQASVDINADFQLKEPTGVPIGLPVGSAIWGVSKWGVGVWGSASQIWRGWRGVRAQGRSAAIRVRVNSQAGRPSWLATNWLYVNGGQL